MKLVFFDLRRDTKALDASRYSEPLATPEAVVAPGPRKNEDDNLYYNSKVMNYFGDTFHVTTAGNKYSWTYAEIKEGSDRLVVKDERKNKGSSIPRPKRARSTSPSRSSWTHSGRDHARPRATSQLPAPTKKPWPATCDDVNGDAITAAIAAGEMGYMHLNGKRLGNLSAMEAMPSSAIIGFADAQTKDLGSRSPGRSSGPRVPATAYKRRSQEELQVEEHRGLLHRPLRLDRRPRLARGPGGQCRVRRDEHHDDPGIQLLYPNGR